MALRADSYGSLAEIEALTRHMMQGQSGFNSTTRPTITEVEKFVDRASAQLNVALEGAGLSSPLNTTTANTTAVLAADDWTVTQTAKYVESTRRGAGSRSPEGVLLSGISDLSTKAIKFVESHALGWKRMGVTEDHRMSEGLTFTGLTVQADRADPDDSGLVQPAFKRKQWDA